jgi:hypothetical protein
MKTMKSAYAFGAMLFTLLEVHCSIARDVDDLSNGMCRADGVKNGAETDIDCGGGCGLCANDRVCKSGADCQSDRCEDTGSGARLCKKQCGVADASSFDCLVVCASDQVCVKRGDAVPGCEPLMPTCKPSLYDCAADYCTTEESAVRPGHIACAEPCS